MMHIEQNKNNETSETETEKEMEMEYPSLKQEIDMAIKDENIDAMFQVCEAQVKGLEPGEDNMRVICNYLKEKCARLVLDKAYELKDEEAGKVCCRFGKLLKDLYCEDDAMPYFRLAAEKGNSDAQFVLGTYLKCITFKEEEAFSLIKSAADKGHVGAMVELAYMYEYGNVYKDGENLDKDLDKAKFWMEKAAAEHNIDALNWLGSHYENGRYVREDVRNDEEAFKYYLQAAVLENAYAQYKVAEMLEKKAWTCKEEAERSKNEKGKSENLDKANTYIEEAKEWYDKSIAKKCREAFFGKARLLEGNGGLSDEVVRLYEVGVHSVQVGDEARIRLAQIYLGENGNYKNIDSLLKMFKLDTSNRYGVANKIALRMWKIIADPSSVDVSRLSDELKKVYDISSNLSIDERKKIQFELGVYLTRKIPQSEPEEGIRMFKLAAEPIGDSKGYIPALKKLGYL